MNAGERWEAFLWLLDEREAIDLAVARDERSRDAAHERLNRRRGLARQAAAEGRPLAESRLLSSFVTGFRQTERALVAALRRAGKLEVEREAAAVYVVAMRERPLRANAARKGTRQEKARTMRDEGRTISYIARTLKVHARTVERYLVGSETATGRDTPG